MADTNDAFQFFQEEAKVVTASRIPESGKGRRHHVCVTREDIQASGAQIFGIFCGPFQEWMSYRPALTKPK